VYRPAVGERYAGYAADEREYGDPKPTGQLTLPVGSISLVNASAVSSNLQSVAIVVPGDGAVFQTSVGDRKAKVDNLQGAWFDGNERCYAQVQESDGSVGLENIDLTGSGVSSLSPPWFLAINQTRARLMFSGPVVISIEAPRWGEGELKSESKDRLAGESVASQLTSHVFGYFVVY
jgi:hypothetical protein